MLQGKVRTKEGSFSARAILFPIWLVLTVQALAQPQAVYQKFDPEVIPIDQTQPILFQVRIDGGTPSRVVFEYNPNSQPTGADFEMRDDGTGGDRTPGDGIYSLTFQAAQITPGLQPSDVFRRFIGYVKLFQGATQLSRVNIFADIFTDEIPRRPVITVAADMQRTDHLVNIFFPGFFANDNFDLVRAARRFYEIFRDEYDFLNIVATPSYFRNRNHFAVKNDVQGIGLRIFDNSANYGSTGRLMGITVFPIPGFFDGAETGYQHELGHQWINFLGLAPLSSGVPHWPISSLASGTMGYSDPVNRQGLQYRCQLIPEAGGVRLVRQIGEPVFTDLDMYLMGLLPPEQVGEHLVFTDQVQARSLACNNQLFTGEVTRVKISDIINAVGARVPAADAAPKRFKIATVLVSRDGLLSEEAMAYYSFFAKRAEETREVAFHSGFSKGTVKPFALSTGGRGSLDVQIGATRNPILANVSAASYSGATLASESIVASFGANLAVKTEAAMSVPLPTALAGTTVKVRDSVGMERLAPLFFVSPAQVNYQVPPGTALGQTSITVTDANGTSTSGVAFLSTVAPGLFAASATGQGVAAAVALRVRADRTENFEPVASFDAEQGKFLSIPIDLGPEGDQVFLVLFGTGIRFRSSLSEVGVKISGTDAPVLFAGGQDNFVGLDQINLRLLRSLIGRGEVTVRLTVDGKVTNAVTVNIK